MNLFYAWSMYTDEIKIFRFEYARDTFVKNSEEWVAVDKKELK